MKVSQLFFLFTFLAVLIQATHDADHTTEDDFVDIIENEVVEETEDFFSSK